MSRVHIEQHIALGWSHDRIADKLGINVRAVDDVLAAMDKALDEEDSWWNEPPTLGRHTSPNAMPCGTHAAYNRHKNAGQTPDEACVQGERDYQAARRFNKHIENPPPHARHDQAAILRAMGGERITLTRTETIEAVQRLTEVGLTAAEVAHRLGVAKRTITRYRSRGRAA